MREEGEHGKEQEGQGEGRSWWSGDHRRWRRGWSGKQGLETSRQSGADRVVGLVEDEVQRDSGAQLAGASGARGSGAVVGRRRKSREVAGLDLRKKVVGRLVKKRRSTG